MQKRKLGNLEVSAIGLGCMSMSFGYGPVPCKNLSALCREPFCIVMDEEQRVIDRKSVV